MDGFKGKFERTKPVRHSLRPDRPGFLVACELAMLADQLRERQEKAQDQSAPDERQSGSPSR